MNHIAKENKMRISKTMIGEVAVSLVLLLAVFRFGVAFAEAPVAKESQVSAEQVRVMETYGKLPLSFEANAGQTASEVKFLSRGNGYQLYLTPTEAVMTFQSSKEKEPVGARFNAPAPPQDAVPAPSAAPAPPDVSQAVVKMKFLGASKTPKISGESPLPGKVNYFVGKDQSKWRANVPTYGKVRYASVYPGIDLLYYGNQRQLEYDLVVAPGADPKTIRLAFEGVGRLEVDAQGALVLNTAAGRIVQHKPVIYQEVAGERKEIAGRYRLKERREVAFEVARYDATQPLVIDPVLAYSTYLGGSGFDFGYGIAVDGSGSAYVTGRTTSTNFPLTTPFQGTNGVGYYDVFVAKLNAAGSGLSYATYLGGSGDDVGYGIAVDGSGSAYVTGYTNSTNFPLATPFQGTHGGGFYDAFVAKLNAAGSGLSYATYLGGGGSDSGSGIAVDETGAAYVTGYTLSTNFPLATPFQGEHFSDAFVAKLNAAGSGLSYATYLGGSGYDYGYGIAVDGSGSAYVTGRTSSSTDFPLAKPFQRTHGGGFDDAFVAKLNAAGSGLSYATYLGGSRYDSGHGIAVDGSGSAYVTGETWSTDFPLATPFQGTNGGGSDAFVAKLNVAGSGLSYAATYLGGSDHDYGNGIAVDGSGSAYVTGYTLSTDFPLGDAFQGTHSGSSDVFVAKLNAAGSGLSYATYLGGSGYDKGSGIAVDGSGSAYVTGYNTRSTDFPLATPFQGTYGGGGSDAFVAKIDPSTPTPTQAPTGLDIDGDGIPNATDPDMDGDGVANGTDLDTNGDGVPNTTDLDDDSDGTADLLDDYANGEGTPPTCQGQTATIFGDGANNILIGTTGPDVIHGLGGNDIINGRAGDDILCGGAGKDKLYGKKGNDNLYGQAGKDRLKGGGGTDACDGGVDTDKDRASSSCETKTNVP